MRLTEGLPVWSRAWGLPIPASPEQSSPGEDRTQQQPRKGRDHPPTPRLASVRIGSSQAECNAWRYHKDGQKEPAPEELKVSHSPIVPAAPTSHMRNAHPPFVDVPSCRCWLVGHRAQPSRSQPDLAHPGGHGRGQRSSPRPPTTKAPTASNAAWMTTVNTTGPTACCTILSHCAWLNTSG